MNIQNTQGSLSFFSSLSIFDTVCDSISWYNLSPAEKVYDEMDSSEMPMYLEILGALLDHGYYSYTGSTNATTAVMYTGEYSFRETAVASILAKVSNGILYPQMTAHSKAGNTTCTTTWRLPMQGSDKYGEALANIACVVHRIARQINYSHHEAHLYEYIEDLEAMVHNYRQAIVDGVSDKLDLLDYLDSTREAYVATKMHQRKVALADAYYNELQGLFQD